MSWFNTRGACAERILFSKARYVRNAAKLPFGNLSDRTKLSSICSKIEKTLTSGGFRAERLPSCSTPSVLSLAEKQFIDADLLMSDCSATVFFNEPCNLTVTVGGRDLISIQSVMAGRSIVEAKNSAAVAEEMLDSEINFAYSESIGYLCERPELCGTGLELSAGLYLPSLRLLDSFDRLQKRLISRGAVLSPMFNHPCREGDLYLLRYLPPHLCDEQSAVLFFDSLLRELDSAEEADQRMLFPDSSSPVEDAAYRALGILSCARKMSECEMLGLLSDVRLALSAKAEVPPDLPRIEDVNFLSIEGLNCCLCASSDQRFATENELELCRAEFLRKYISARITSFAAI